MPIVAAAPFANWPSSKSHDELSVEWKIISNFFNIIIPPNDGGHSPSRVLILANGQTPIADSSTPFIQQAQKTFPELRFAVSDAHTVLSAADFTPFDLVIVPAATGQLSPGQQPEFFSNLRRLLASGGMIILVAARGEAQRAAAVLLGAPAPSNAAWPRETTVNDLFGQSGFQPRNRAHVYFDPHSRSFALDAASNTSLALSQISMFKLAPKNQPPVHPEAIEQQALAFLKGAETGMQKGDFGMVRDAVDQALALLPDHPELLVSRGFAQFQLGHRDAACRDFAHARALEPDHIPAHENLAAALTALGQSVEAEAVLRDALALHPAHPAFTRQLADCLRANRKFSEAAGYYWKILEHEPNDLSLWRALEHCHEQNGELLAARLVHQEIARRDPARVPNPAAVKAAPPAPTPIAAPPPAPAKKPAPTILFPSKVTLENLQFTLKEAAWKFPKKRLVILLDQALVVPDRVCLDCRALPISEFVRGDFQDTVYVYACDSDETGAPFVEEIIFRGGVFLPVYEAIPSFYIHNNDTARRVLEAEYIEQSAAGFAKWDFGPHDFINLLQALDVTAKLDGDFIEIGSFRGSSGCVVLRYLREIGLRRDCYFLDVFEGFEYAQAKTSADAYWAGTHQTEGKDTVEKRLRKYEQPGRGPTVFVAKSNIIDDALPPGIQKICVANIDVDLYEAVLVALQKVAPFMVKGGIMIVEDPGHTPLLIGARVALNQFLKTSAATGFLPLYMQSGQVFLVRL